MKKEILKPDYNNSILNMMTSILKNYGVKSNHDSLPELDKILEKKYKNVVLVILDGMGENVINKASNNGYFNKYKKKVITSIYPSTTAAALTTFYSGKAPIETGWIGWSQYFKECGRAIDMLPHVDSYTGEPISRKVFDAYELLKYKTVYQQIKEASPEVETYEIKPTHCDMKAEKCIHINNLKDLCDSIKTLCKSKSEKYVFAYFDSPDKINHRNYWDSEATKEFILYAEDLFKKLNDELKGTDTLMIISADHGHTNMNKYYNALEIDELKDCYIMPPSIEPRFLSFWIKEDKKDYFKRTFKEKFKDEFILYTKQEFLNSNLLGYGDKHRKIDDFLGDFMAVAISDAMISIKVAISREKYKKLSNHCGLTREEMEVPLIIVDLK